MTLVGASTAALDAERDDRARRHLARTALAGSLVGLAAWAAWLIAIVLLLISFVLALGAAETPSPDSEAIFERMWTGAVALVFTWAGLALGSAVLDAVVITIGLRHRHGAPAIRGPFTAILSLAILGGAIPLLLGALVLATALAGLWGHAVMLILAAPALLVPTGAARIAQGVCAVILARRPLPPPPTEELSRTP